MTRFSRAGVLLMAGWLSGCAEPAEPPFEAEPDTFAVGLDTGPEDIEDAEGFSFRTKAESGPTASYVLDEGAECLAYSAYIVRLTPVEDGAGHTIELVVRPEATSPLDVCSAEGEIELPTRAGVDTFVALDGTILWTTSDAQGRDLLTGYDFEAEEEVFAETVTPPVVKNADGLMYGGPLETMTTMDDLDAAGVTCPEADAWFADRRTVAISRRLLFSFESGETTDAGDALCLVLDEA